MKRTGFFISKVISITITVILFHISFIGNAGAEEYTVPKECEDICVDKRRECKDVCGQYEDKCEEVCDKYEDKCEEVCDKYENIPVQKITGYKKQCTTAPDFTTICVDVPQIKTTYEKTCVSKSKKCEKVCVLWKKECKRVCMWYKQECEDVCLRWDRVCKGTSESGSGISTGHRRR